MFDVNPPFSLKLPLCNSVFFVVNTLESAVNRRFHETPMNKYSFQLIHFLESTLTARGMDESFYRVTRMRPLVSRALQSEVP